MNEFSFSDLIMLNHLFKKFQLVIASIAMIASTSLPLGVLQIGAWANMFEQFYEETHRYFFLLNGRRRSPMFGMSVGIGPRG